MKLKLNYKQAYGHDRFYGSCERSRALLELSGKKCFTTYDIQKLKSIGFELEVIMSEVQLEKLGVAK